LFDNIEMRYDLLLCRVNEKANGFFCLQERRGHGEGKGLAARFIGTLDNIRDSRPPPYRILLQTVRHGYSV